MSTVDLTPEVVERNKRATLRTINSLKAQIETALAQNPSDDVAHQAKALIDLFKEAVIELKDVTNDLLDMVETTSKTPAQITAAEDKVSADYNKALGLLGEFRGKLGAMFSRLSRSQELSNNPRQSLNSSLCDGVTPANPLVKLPDIKVPTFDGKIQNFTDWNSLFSAMIDSNDNLKPVQKLYYLKQAMTGDAQNLLKDYALQEGLYESAYNSIKERCYNKRVIIANHFHDLLGLPQVSQTTLRDSLDKVNALIRGLTVCGIDTAKMSPLITYIVVQKLPAVLRTDWENSHHDYSTYPSYEPLHTFLQNRCFSFESSHIEASVKPNHAKSATVEKGKQKTSLATVSKTAADRVTRKCILCGQNHILPYCSDFLQKPVADRFTIVREKQLCINCLKRGHTAIDCSSSKCRTCSKSHNTLLHREIMQSSPVVQQPVSNASKAAENDKPDDSKTNNAVLTLVQPKSRIILLPTAVVNVQLDSSAHFVKTRVLIDPCSQVNLVSEMFVRKHHLKPKSSLSTIAGVSPSDFTSCASVKLHLTSRVSDYSMVFEANIVERIPYEVTANIIKMVDSMKGSLQLADVSLPSTKVDILIGGEFANQILLGNKKYVGELAFEESQFGWVASGPLSSPTPTHYCHLVTTVEDTLAQFWSVEEVSPPTVEKSEYELCELHFMRTHERLPNGRFQIRLPFKRSATELANTYHQARAALHRYETKTDPAVRVQYVDFMDEYQRLGHMQPASSSNARRFFIPHLPVLRPESTTTKLRVVFNASANNSSGVSLNQVLMVGPTLQPELFDILLHFRMYRVAFAADISRMYRQIAVHPDDCCFQSILWRSSTDQPIITYELTTLTQGTAPASYIATKCLQQLGMKAQQSSPEAAYAITNEFYMDDLLTGADTVEAAITKRERIQAILDSAHLPLRKYVSNSSEFLSSLDPDLVETLRTVQFSSTGTTKLLGLQWKPEEDVLVIHVPTDGVGQKLLTKRLSSSYAARMFDPLGYIAPVTIRAKILLQDVWREGKDWDEPVSPELDRRFREYFRDTQSLSDFSLPRAYFSSPCHQNFDLFGFCDSSTRAYGAVIYIREQSTKVCSLVCAKSKVAPIKELTIPRLELLGAVLLSKLMSRVAKTFEYDLSKATVFCDSMIVLAWLKGPSSQYQVFVRNRVAFVTSIIPFNQWHYVSTSDNPADLLTRGITVASLIDSQLWLHGPPWLSTDLFNHVEFSLPLETPEMQSACHIQAVNADVYDESILKRYSSLDKLIQVIASVARFIYHTRPSLTRYDVSTETYMKSTYIICRISQFAWFRADLNTIKKKVSLSKNSVLLALDPFIDSNGLLRVGGRLGNAPIAYDSKHPIIISRKSLLAELLVRHIHEMHSHATHSLTLSRLQARYHIVGGAYRLVKKLIASCVWCSKQKGASIKQIMGDLPTVRTTPARPFSKVGVDFGGPFIVKCTNHRSMKHLKHYAAFFVCMITRAVHIEVVSDLSTLAFIAAFQRFCARRGICQSIWSDNATNFLGADNVFKQHCTSLNITWHNIPARSPHHGGVWEAAVKAGKRCLLAHTRNMVTNVEQLSTLLALVEAILNSRPLYRTNRTTVSDVIDIITPGHFLVGSCLLDVAEPDLIDISLSDRLSALRDVIRLFWQEWRKCYLSILQSRTKWKVSSPNLVVGDIVLLKDDNLPPLRWSLGRVVACHPDRHGKVRIVEVKTHGSILQRAVQRLVKLPVESSAAV